MTRLLTLLVSRDPSVIHEIRLIHDEMEAARLEVCGRSEAVSSRLDGSATLLVVHHDRAADPGQLRTLLAAADRTFTRAVVVEGPCGERDEPPALGPHPVYRLPADLPALRDLLRSVYSEAVDAGAAPQPNPLNSSTSAPLDTAQGNDVRRVAGQTTTVLLTGETGSGKSMLAKAIHAASPRKDEPYLVVDCGALAGHLIESEMFGHVRGAFTGAERERQGKFAAAGTGTLVLDEINSLPLPLQAKLLRAVEERVFEPVGSNKSEPLRARLIAVSNVPLEEEVRRERFRADLFYRLNVVDFRIPPLRERPAAVIPLAHQLLRSSATAACQGVTAISPAALEAMLAYNWPGNVRELRNVIERAAALAAGPVVQLADLPESIRGRSAPASALPAVSRPAVFNPAPAVEIPFDGDDEAGRILAVLRKHNNNRRRAAAELGLSRVSLYKKLHKYGLFVRKQRAPQMQVG